MISDHVTCFILLHWLDIFFLFCFFFSSSFPSESSLASQNAFSLVWIPHGSSSWTTLVYISFDFIYGGLFGFWSARRSPLPLPPSPSLPWLSPELPFQRWASTRSPSRPASSGLPRACLDVLPCAPCSAAQYFSGFNCCVVAGENQQKGFQLFRKREMGFPQWVFAFLLSTLFFSIQCDLVTLGARLRKEYQGLLLISVAFSFLSVGFDLFSF